MSCSPKFDRAVPTECLISVTSDIMGGRMSIEVASKITWSVGCILTAFGPAGPPPTHELTIAMDGQEPTLESVAAKLNESLNANPIVHSFAAQNDPSKAINPATLALLLQLAQYAFTWLQNRGK
jgi:hypothetical protein